MFSTSQLEVTVWRTHQSHQVATVIIIIIIMTRDSLVGRVSRLRAGRPGNRGSIFGRSGGFTSFPKRPGLLWADQPSVQGVHGGFNPHG